jgi:N-acyl-L-homoserine lactone synthetase
MRKANIEYVNKVANLSDEESERLLSRMRGKLTRRVDDKKLGITEAIAIQLELEDEQLEEWRENRIKINEKFKNT